MRDDQQIVLMLPRFTYWMKRLAILLAGIWMLEVALSAFAPSLLALTLPRVWLSGASIWPGLQLWRLVSHAFVDDPSSFSIVWTVLSLWLLGSPVERTRGVRTVALLLAAGVLMGGLALVGTSLVLRSVASSPVVGMSAFSSSLVIALGFEYAEQPVTFFGLGPMKGKHLSLGFVMLTVLIALVTRSAGSIVSLGGYLGGLLAMLWLRRAPSTTGGRSRKDSRNASKFKVVQGGKKDKDRFDIN